MSIEGDDDISRQSIPYSYATIRVSNSEQIGLSFTLRDGSDFSLAFGVMPSTEQLSLLDVPAQDFFIGADVGSSCASAP